MKKGFINGCFDVLHVGHIEMIRYARSRCDYLMVALDTDERVASAKGPERPFNTLKDRITMMRALRGVDEVRCFSTDEELSGLVEIFSPDFMFVGSDWRDKKIIGGEYAKELIYFGRIDGYSTTKILENSISR